MLYLDAVAVVPPDYNSLKSLGRHCSDKQLEHL
jgi:hypothetical protein